MSELVLCDIADGIATITLNRPDMGNAIDAALTDELAAAIDRVAGHPALRAVLLTGRGKAFCVGGDIGEMRRSDDLVARMEKGIDILHDAMRQLMALPVPIISALNGPLGGGGISVGLCADLVLAAESMKLRGGYSAIGLTPDLGAAWFLAHRAGAARAKEILFLNRAYSAHECLAMGIVNAVYPDAQLPEEARKTARQLADGATLSLARIKRLVDEVGLRTFEEHLALEREYMVASARSGDGREGIAAFIEKRAPRFAGQ